MNENLSIKCQEIRYDTAKMINGAQSGHLGSSLSIVELLVVLYYKVLNLNETINRDYFVLSKGHGVVSLYAIFVDKKWETGNLRQLNSSFQGHPDSQKCPSIEISTGSLGQGLANAVGIAYAQKLRGFTNKVYVIVGDGEFQEGIVYESLMFAANHKLNNLVVILDNNGWQLNDSCQQITAIDYQKFVEALGFNYLQINGHELTEIEQAFAFNSANKPLFINALTKKGKGISAIENTIDSHNYIPTLNDLEQLRREHESN